jgi:hypothetical protein
VLSLDPMWCAAPERACLQQRLVECWLCHWLVSFVGWVGAKAPVDVSVSNAFHDGHSFFHQVVCHRVQRSKTGDVDGAVSLPRLVIA